MKRYARRSLILLLSFTFSFPPSFSLSFFFPVLNGLPVSLYDVQHAPFLLSTSMAPLVATRFTVIIPPCTLNTVIPEFLRRVVYGNPRVAAINIPANTKIATLGSASGHAGDGRRSR